MLRRLYDRLLELAARPTAERWLALVALIDGAIFTLPPELLQVPMSIARPTRALRYAAVGCAFTAAGSVAAYLIGAGLFEAVALPLLRFLGRETEFHHFATDVAGNAWLWPLAFFVAPMPAGVAAGSVHFGIIGTVAASVIGRGARFLIVALFLKRFGAVAGHWIHAHFHRFLLALAALLGGFVLIRYAL